MEGLAEISMLTDALQGIGALVLVILIIAYCVSYAILCSTVNSIQDTISKMIPVINHISKRLPHESEDVSNKVEDSQK